LGKANQSRVGIFILQPGISLRSLKEKYDYNHMINNHMMNNAFKYKINLAMILNCLHVLMHANGWTIIKWPRITIIIIVRVDKPLPLAIRVVRSPSNMVEGCDRTTPKCPKIKIEWVVESPLMRMAKNNDNNNCEGGQTTPNSHESGSVTLRCGWTTPKCPKKKMKRVRGCRITFNKQGVV
jgi:hypothetical protein